MSSANPEIEPEEMQVQWAASKEHLVLDILCECGALLYDMMVGPHLWLRHPDGARMRVHARRTGAAP